MVVMTSCHAVHAGNEMLVGKTITFDFVRQKIGFSGAGIGYSQKTALSMGKAGIPAPPFTTWTVPDPPSQPRRSIAAGQTVPTPIPVDSAGVPIDIRTPSGNLDPRFVAPHGLLFNSVSATCCCHADSTWCLLSPGRT